MNAPARKYFSIATFLGAISAPFMGVETPAGMGIPMLRRGIRMQIDLLIMPCLTAHPAGSVIE